MSRIVELAQAIDDEMIELRHRVDYLQGKLANEKARRIKHLQLMKEIIEQYEKEEEDDYV